MYPEDRVLVGVINRKSDFELLRAEQWYRIPQLQMPRGVHTEYVAFFLSGKQFKEKSGTIPYFAEFRGLELRYRSELILDKPNHPRASDIYYKLSVAEIQEKMPPIVNTTKRPISFIYTTWDRFAHAETITDLYTTDDFFVDRVYHALDARGVNPSRTWDAERRDYSAPSIRVLCQHAEVIASTEAGEGVYQLDSSIPDDAILREILALIRQNGGAVTTGFSSY